MIHPFIKTCLENKEKSGNYLCVGIDPDLEKLPESFEKTIGDLERFLIEVIEITQEHCVCYKPNISFFEALGIDGLKLLERIRKRIPKTHPVIIDAKRGDIGNTSKMQARFIYDYFGADATTLHPYMGIDSLAPFFEYKDKYNFVLAYTSNPSAIDFENAIVKTVIKKCNEWQKAYQNIGLVVGSTHGKLSELRKLTDLLFLIPGAASQGGSYSVSVKYGINKDNLVLVNQSRSILYASRNNDYKAKIKEVVKERKLY